MWVIFRRKVIIENITVTEVYGKGTIRILDQSVLFILLLISAKSRNESCYIKVLIKFYHLIPSFESYDMTLVLSSYY